MVSTAAMLLASGALSRFWASTSSVVGLSAVKSVARWATDTDAMALTAKNSAVLLNFMKNSC